MKKLSLEELEIKEDLTPEEELIIKRYKRGIINAELKFHNDIMAIDKNTVERGRVLSLDTFVTPATFAIGYCAIGALLSVASDFQLSNTWFFIGVGITIIMAATSLYIKWAIWDTLVKRSQDSLKNSENEIIKLNKELEELDED